MKLDSLYGNPIGLTQSPHGVQDKKAIDTNNRVLYAPYHIEIRASEYHHIRRYHKVAKVYTEQDTWFDIRVLDTNAIIEAAHGKPYRLGIFKPGEPIGEYVPYYNNTTGKRADHWHTAIKVDNIWDVILNYIKRTNTIKLFGSPFNPKWAMWPTYSDKELLLLSKPEMVKLQKGLQIKTLNSEPMYLRKEPRTGPDYGRIVPGNTIYNVVVVAQGEKVSQNGRTIDTWYQINVNGLIGYVNGCWTDELLGSAQEIEILKNQLKIQTGKVEKSKVKNQELTVILNS